MTNRYHILPITPDDQNPADFLSRAIWTHVHPGWLRPIDYPSECRCFRIQTDDEPNRAIFQFGITKIFPDAGWLEFAAAADASDNLSALSKSIRESLRNLGIRHCYFLPAVDNPLISGLIDGMNFRPIDRIVSLSRHPQIPIPPPQNSERFIISEIGRMDHARIDLLLQIDRTFPMIWRLSEYEFELAMTGANRRFIAYDPASGETAAYLIAWEEERSVHIIRIAVREDYRNEGISTELVSTLIRTLPTGKSFTVNTYQKNAAALRVYEKLGFKRETEFWTLYQADTRKLTP